MFCKHNYKKVNQFETKSQIEVANQVDATFSGAGGRQLKKKYITDYTCEKCGKLKRLIVKN
jgi:hypothetical protein